MKKKMGTTNSNDTIHLAQFINGYWIWPINNPNAAQLKPVASAAINFPLRLSFICIVVHET